MLVRLDQGVLKAVAAESVTKLHPKMSAPGVTHTVTVNGSFKNMNPTTRTVVARIASATSTFTTKAMPVTMAIPSAG